MNKKELFERISRLPSDCSRPRPMIDKLTTLELIKLLDEPQKPIVPQFVADEIEYFKKTGDWDLFQAMDYSFGKNKIRDWLEFKHNQETFARAWLDGYTVDEEKRYRVRIKGVYYNSCLIFDKINKKWFLSSIYEIDHQIGSHTRKELEQAGFGWVFDCEGVEVEEVE